MIKKPNILVVGSFIMDLISTASRLPVLGETVIGNTFTTAPGGKGANQAVQAARLGAKVDMAGCVGEDAFGQQMLEAVKSAGVNTDHVITTCKSSTGIGNVQIQKNESGVQNRIVVIPGANHVLCPADLSWLEESICQYDIVIMQLELTMEVTKYVASVASKAGVPVMLNPAPAASLDDELLSCVTFLTPNETEAALLSGHELRADENGVNEEDLKEVSKILRAKGVGKIMITLGCNGSVVCSEDGLKYTSCVKMPNVIDPTAAGDSFIGAFCTGITAGLNEKQAMDFASHTAAITVCGMGAIPSLPTLDKVQSLMIEKEYKGFNPQILNVLEK